MRKSTFLLASMLMLAGATVNAQQTTVTDDFSTTHDYVANGVAGTIWDAVVLNQGYVVAAADVEAEITVLNTSDSTGVLTFATISSYWGGDNDNGAALVKKVKADTDFEVQVKIVGDMPSFGDAAVAYLMTGLFARTDSKIADDSTGFVAIQAFDQYDTGYGLRNSTGTGNRGIEENWTNTDDDGDVLTAALYPYIKLKKTGNDFTGYCSKNGTDWFQFSETYTRDDLAGKVLQVGIYNSTYTTNEGSVQFDDFSITGEFVSSGTSVKQNVVAQNFNVFCANNTVVVESADNNLVSEVNVYSVDGKLVNQSKISATKVNVDVPANGIYVVVVNKQYKQKVAAF